MGLPTMEGNKPQDIAQVFNKGLMARSIKVSDAMGRLQVIPLAERSDNVKKFPPQFLQEINPLPLVCIERSTD